jgi:hypothetical protein
MTRELPHSFNRLTESSLSQLEMDAMQSRPSCTHCIRLLGGSVKIGNRKLEARKARDTSKLGRDELHVKECIMESERCNESY